MMYVPLTSHIVGVIYCVNFMTKSFKFIESVSCFKFLYVDCYLLSNQDNNKFFFKGRIDLKLFI